MPSSKTSISLPLRLPAVAARRAAARAPPAGRESRPAPPALRLSPACVRRCRAAARRPLAGRWRATLAARCLRGRQFGVIVLVLVGAVRHLVEHGLRVRPQPRERPEQPAEHERQQAQHLDRVASADGGACARSSRAARARARTATITTIGTMKITTSAITFAAASKVSPERWAAYAGRDATQAAAHGPIRHSAVDLSRTPLIRAIFDLHSPGNEARHRSRALIAARRNAFSRR